MVTISKFPIINKDKTVAFLTNVGLICWAYLENSSEQNYAEIFLFVKMEIIIFSYNIVNLKQSERVCYAYIKDFHFNFIYF